MALGTDWSIRPVRGTQVEPALPAPKPEKVDSRGGHSWRESMGQRGLVVPHPHGTMAARMAGRVCESREKHAHWVCLSLAAGSDCVPCPAVRPALLLVTTVGMPCVVAVHQVAPPAGCLQDRCWRCHE